MDILELFKRKLLENKSTSSKSTLKNYLSDVRHFISWFEKSTHSQFEAEIVTSDAILLYEKTLGGIIENGNINPATQLSAASMKRHLSSLRKFFSLLEISEIISTNPFKQIQPKVTEEPTDLWHLRSFKDALQFQRASKITVKNYLSDIAGFARWYEETILPGLEKPLSSTGGFYLITQEILEDYRKRLLEIQNAAPRTVNRKLSALRRYLNFASEKGFITTNELTIDPVRLYEEKINALNEPSVELAELPKITTQPKTYSIIPPVRLLQKLVIYPYLALEEKAATSIATLIAGKPLSGIEKLSPKLASIVEAKNKLRSKTNSVNNILGIRNLSKEFYAPEKISLLGVPLYKKIIHHAKFTRPNWYKRYHNYSFVHYVHFALLVIFASGVGVALYQNLVAKKQMPTYAAATAPPRIISFQGRLTDNLDNPITSTSALRFAIYNDPSASGAALLWQEAITDISPDQDGIFSILLGGGTQIPSTVFTDNSQVYLGVTVGTTTELTPRQRIASVGYATNAEFLQGQPPTTQAGLTSFTNVLLALDSSGNLTLADSGATNHTFQVSNGAFNLKGQTLYLTTNSGSSGNVILSPDGLGKIDTQHPIINSTTMGNIVAGGVEVNDKFGVLATESAVAAFIVNNNTSGGDILAASSSGTTRFKIANDGTLTDGVYGTAGGIFYGSNSSGTFAQTTSGAIGQCLQSTAGGTPTWGACGGNSSPFQELAGSIVPFNATEDLLVGGQTTASAKFRFINNNTGTPVASISANTTNNATFLSGDGSLGTSNRQTLTIGNSSTYNSTGNLLFNPNGVGKIGIGTPTPLIGFDLRGNSGTTAAASISANTSFATLLVDNSGAGDLFVASASGVPNFIVRNNGDVVVGQDGGGKLTVSVIDPYLVQNQKTTGTQSLTFQTMGATNADFIFKNVNTTLSTLTQAGQFQLPITGSTGGLVLGGDTQIFRGAADRLDLASGDSFNIVNGSLLTNGTTRIDSSGNGTFVNLNVTGTCTGCLSAANSPFGMANGTISPYNTTVDFLLGAQATTSAKFAVLNINSGTPVASVSSGLSGTSMYMTADGTLSTQNRQSLTIGNSTTYNTTGNVLINPNGTGNVGIGTSNPQQKFNIYDTSAINSGTQSTQRIYTTLTPTTTNYSSGVEGLNIFTELNNSTAVSTSNTNAYIRGFYSEAPNFSNQTIYATYGGTSASGVGVGASGGITNAYGWHGYVYQNGTGTITNAFPFFSEVRSTGVGTIDTAVNYYADASKTAGTVNTIIGFKMADVSSVATNQYGILTYGKSRFGDNALPSATLEVAGDLNVSGARTGKALTIFNQTGDQDILTASSAGITKFTISNTGAITDAAYTNAGGILYTSTTGLIGQTSVGTGIQCLIGGTIPSWGSCATGGTDSPFTIGNGTIYPLNSTQDFLLGAQATTSAKFAVLNINSGTPVASVSSGLNGNGMYFTADGSLATQKRQTLTIGNSTTYNTTGNVLINPNGTGRVGINTANPTAPLTVDGDIEVGNGISTRQIVEYNASRTNHGALELYNLGTGNLTLSTDFSSGNIVLTPGASGSIQMTNFTTNGGILYTNGSGVLAQTAAGSGAQCLLGGTTPTWGTCGTGGVDSTFTSNLGSIIPLNSTLDFMIGGQATSSAKFAVLNIDSGTPVASVSATAASNRPGLYMSGNGTLSSVNKGTLTIGSSDTGNISIGTDTTVRGLILGNTTGASTLTLNSGTGAINIGTSIAKTITIGNTTTTTAINFDTGTGGINFGDNANTKTIDIGGVTNSGTDTINIATNSTAADTLSIGNTNASTTVAITGGTAWGITSGGVLTVASCTGCGGGVGTGTWTLGSGIHYPNNNTADLLVGGTSTSSAKFAVLNINSGAPTASISANNGGGAIYIAGDGTISTTNSQSLSIGSASSGQLSLSSLGNVVFQNPGTANLYVGQQAGTDVSNTGSHNSFVGYQAGFSNTSGSYNLFMGDSSGYANLNGINNNFLGVQAGVSNTSGSYNSFVGNSSGANNSSGSSNAFFGESSGYFNSTADFNTFIGNSAGFSNSTGTGNVFLGYLAGDTATGSNANTTGNNNTFLGFQAGPGTSTQLTNAAAIGYNALVSRSNSLVLGGTGVNAVNVGIGTTAPLAPLHVNGGYGSNALIILNQTNNGNILTASSSGTTKFTVGNDGQVQIVNLAADPGTALGAGSIYYNTANLALKFYNGSTWSSIGSGSSPFKEALGAIIANQPTEDFLIGGNATSSAKFAVLNMNSGTPTVSVNGSMKIGTVNAPTNTLQPDPKFQVYSTLGTSPAASISAQNSTAPIMMLNTEGTGDLLVASVGGQTKFRIDNSGGIHNNGGLSNDYGDFAEYYKKANISEVFAAGQLVCIQGNGVVKCSDNSSSQKILGIISDRSFLRGNASHADDPNYVLVGMVGQLGVWVNGDVKAGDPLTFSSTPGVATVAKKETNIIGYAQEGNNGTIKRVDSVIQPTYFNPNTALQNDSVFNSLTLGIQNDVNSVFDSFGNSINHIDAFSKAIIGSLQAGFANIQTLAVNSLTATTSSIGNATAATFAVAANTITIGGQDLKDIIAQTVQHVIASNPQLLTPTAQTDHIKTNMISPLADNSSVQLNANKDNFELKNTDTGKTVAWFNNQGNATISGQLTSDGIQTSNATVSGTLASGSIQTTDASVAGTLRAGTIVANNISGLDQKLATLAAALQNNSSASNSSQTNNNYLSSDTIHANFGIFEQGITSMGPVTSNIITATDQLAVGNSFTITNNAINTVGADLQIQSLRQGNIAFENGLIKMDTDGNMLVSGNLNLLGEIDAVHGVFSGTLTAPALATGLISPLPGDDLTIRLSDSASTSGKLKITNNQNQEVLSINSHGDLNASGSGTFAKLNFNLVGKAEATSLTEAIATGSAGFATLRQNQVELTIENPIITSKSLIYITPYGDTGNKVLYLLRQVPQSATEDGSFTVGISGTPAPTDTQFNWLIVN